MLFAPQQAISRQQKQKETWYRCRNSQQLNGDGRVRSRQIEDTADDKRPRSRADGVGGPRERVQRRKPLNTEITAQQVRCDVAFAPHAESDECRRDNSRAD